MQASAPSPWLTPRVEGAVALLAVGTMNFGRRTSADEAERIIARALERGLTFFDTANAYADGESERIVGRALRARRDGVQIATKCGIGKMGSKPEGLSRARVLGALDESLARLGTEYVDVYYLHAPDPATPIEETLSAIAELFHAGKIRAFGVSNYAAWQVLEILMRCDAAGTPRPVLSQVLYNLLIRQLDVEYFKLTARYPIHTTVYNPLAGGLLSGRHERAGSTTAGSRFEKNALYQRRYWSDRFFDLVEAYRALAEAEGRSLVELSYAWLAGCRGVDSLLVGPGTVAHLDAAVDAIARPLSPDARKQVDQIHRDFAGTDATYAR
jgi:aryl-alcohol dehydrogenase-like predicted oxidoreductase